jgi:hypothetical protein
VKPAGSAGSAAIAGSASETGSAAPAKPLVDTIVASSTPNATVEVEGTDSKGPAPFTAKLEKDQAYKARVTAPGFAAQEVDVKGGQDKVTVNLAPKSRAISLNSDPPGAAIVVDGVNTGKQTPAEIELTSAQANKPRIHVVLRKPGFRPVDQVVEAAGWTEDDSHLRASVHAKLVAAVVTTGGGSRPNGAGSASGSGGGSGSGSGSGSDGSSGTPASGGGEGTEPPKPPDPKPPAGSGSGEPEPDWSKPK